MLVMTIGFVGGMLSGCGSKVDYSDPRDVAEKAMEYYYAGDYESMKTLINPANEYRLKDMDRTAKIAAEQREKHPEKATPKKGEFSFKSATEEFTGKEITATSKGAVVSFHSETWPRQVVLEKADGKWYFERFK